MPMRPIHILAVLFFCSTLAFAQTNRGGISGTVLDSNGAAVPGAKVTITNTGTNQSTVVMTSGDGAFTANSLEPALYDITVEATNFRKAIVQRVKVDTASVASVNVVVEVGKVAEEVTIQADGLTVSTDS